VKRIPPPLAPHVPADRRPALLRFEELLAKRAVLLGLIAPGDAASLWERHVIDSLRGVLCLPTKAAAIADIGSGAGLPGIPLAIVRPECSFTLIEPRSRRAAFLELAVEGLGLDNVRVLARAADRAGPARFDVCLARAVADAGRSWALANQLLLPGGALIYWAGASWDESAVELAPLSVRYEVCATPSTEMSGPLVKMTRGAPADGPT
jgi:16S rRNA (guanine527-N7)-methyltransferase